MIYKITNIFGVNVSVSTFLIPLWFVSGNIIAEIYGYRIARNIVVITIIFQIFFGFLISALTLMPHADILDNKILYDDLFKNTLRVAVASSMGLLIGGLYNAYLMVYIRDKLLPKLSFGVRALITSSISELVFTIVVFIIEFHRLTSLTTTFKLIAVSFMFKELTLPVLSLLIAAPIVAYIKNQSPPTDYKSTSIIEMYTDAKTNKSKFRELNIDLGINHPLGQYSNNIPVQNIMFRKFPAGLTFDMHTAPNKQYIIYLDGEVEVTTSGGEKVIFKPGDILLANDTTGMGHITRTIKAGTSVVVRA